jgi:hypothetical protein
MMVAITVAPRMNSADTQTRKATWPLTDSPTGEKPQFQCRAMSVSQVHQRLRIGTWSLRLYWLSVWLITASGTGGRRPT